MTENNLWHLKTQIPTYFRVDCGVPQGSALAPLLFIIYTNGLPNAIKHSKCILFADDTTMFYSTKHLDELYDNISFDLNTLSDWFKANKLSLNVNKTNYMIFKNIQTPDNSKIIKIGTEIIEQTSIAKFVGIFIDDQLNWKTHTLTMLNKLSSGLYALNISKHIISRQLLKCVTFGDSIYRSDGHWFLSGLELFTSCHYGCLSDHEGKGANRLGAIWRQRQWSWELSSAVLVGIDV